jgi:hypothetical protein
MAQLPGVNNSLDFNRVELKNANLESGFFDLIEFQFHRCGATENRH